LLDCGRVRPLVPGEEVRQYLLNVGLQGDLERIPLGVQLAVDVPADAERVRFEITGVQGDARLAWAVYGRVGAHVEHDVVSMDVFGIAVAKPVVYDWVVDGAGADTIEITLDGDRPLVPGERLHLAVTSRNLGDIGIFELATGRIGLVA